MQYEGVIRGAGTCSALAPGPSWTTLHCALERENIPSSPEAAPGRPGSGAAVEMVQGRVHLSQIPETGVGGEVKGLPFEYWAMYTACCVFSELSSHLVGLLPSFHQ